MKNNYIKITRIKSFILFMLFFINIISAGNDNVLKSLDIFDLERVSDPQISPNGSKILYVRSGSDIMTDKRFSNIWIINYDGSNHRPITSGHKSHSQPRWSADGKQIIYVSSSSGSSQIHKRWMDTGETT